MEDNVYALPRTPEMTLCSEESDQSVISQPQLVRIIDPSYPSIKIWLDFFSHDPAQIPFGRRRIPGRRGGRRRSFTGGCAGNWTGVHSNYVPAMNVSHICFSIFVNEQARQLINKSKSDFSLNAFKCAERANARQTGRLAKFGFFSLSFTLGPLLEALRNGPGSNHESALGFGFHSTAQSFLELFLCGVKIRQ